MSNATSGTAPRTASASAPQAGRYVWKNLFSHKGALIGGLLLAAVGTGAWFYQLTSGLLITTDMSNAFPWGLAIAIFAFLVGFAAGGQLLFSYIVRSGRVDLKPYALLSIALAFACGAGAGVAVTIDLGAVRNILNMMLAPNPSSPLTWDMMALTLFILVALVELIAYVRSSHSTRAAKLVRPLALLGVLTAVVLQVVEGLIFALQGAHAWWHSFIMPLDFIAVAVVCGNAIVLLIGAIRAHGDETKRPALVQLGKMLAVAIIVHLALALLELALLSGEGTVASAATLAALARVGGLYATELLLPALAAVLLLGSRGKAKTGLLAACGAITVIGLFAHRLMLLYPAYGANALTVSLPDVAGTYAVPISTGRYSLTGSLFVNAPTYLPAPVEWAAILLPVGLAILLVGLALGLGRVHVVAAEQV